MPEHLEVGLLGPVAVRVDGRDAPVRSAPQRVVLARLALPPARGTSIRELIDAVWPVGPPANPLGRLQVHVSRLRRVVGADRITLEPAGYRLAVDRVDVVEAERLVTEARAVASTDVARAANLLGEALEMWRGEPLSDLPDALPFAPELARLAEWRKQVREEWFALRLAAGEAGPALPDLELAVAADPSREGLTVLMARALQEVGRTAGALQVVDAFRRRLAEDSGLDPSPALTELQRRLLTGDAPRPAGTPLPHRGSGEEFVGRRVELGRLMQQVAKADSGRGGAVLVTGEPGIGKTRLLAEFADVATGHGALVLSGRCLDGAAARPYHPFAQAVEEFVAAGPDVRPGDLAAVAPLVPGLAEPATDPTAPLQPDELRLRLLDGVVRLLLAATGTRTVVVIVDDLHWADPSTIAMLRHIARNTRGNRLLLVATYRSGELAADHPLLDTLAELRSETDCSAVPLPGLEPFAVDRLLGATAGRPLAAVLVAAITAETGGNPFFALEMCRHLLEEDALTPDSDGLLHTRLPLTAVPEGVRQVIARRRRRLSVGANRLLDAAAAIDGPFPFAPVVEVAGLDDATALAALDEALDAGLVTAVTAPDRYDFAHALVRAATYASLNPSRRVRLHRRLAETLADGRSAGIGITPSEIAAQYHRSAVLPGAHLGVDPAFEAAAHARAAGAHDEDAAFLGVACELAHRDDPRLPELLARSATALAWAMRFDRAVAVGREAIDATADRAGPAAAAAVAVTVATALSEAGSNVHAWELAPLGLACAAAGPGTVDPVDLAALTLFDLERRESEDPANPGIPMDVPDRRDALQVLNDSGRLAGRADLARYAVAAVYGTRDRVPESAVDDPTVALLLVGDFAAALSGFESAAATAGARGQLSWELYCRSGIARCHTALGDLAAATEAIAAADALAARVSGERTSWQLTTHLGALDALAMALDTGWDEVIAASAPLLQPGLPEHQWAIATLAAATARGHARLGQAVRARTLLSRPVRALRQAPAWAPNYLRTACDVAETLWLLDDRDHLPDVRIALDAAGRTDFRFPMMDARLALARLCALEGRHDEARRWFAEARSVLDAQSARTLRAVVDHDEALLHTRSGKHEAAQPLLAAARDQFRDLGMTGWERRANALQAPGKRRPTR